MYCATIYTKVYILCKIDGFEAQGGRQKVLVQPSHEVITKKRKLGSRRDDGAK
jgi:hypothetical protein